MTQQINLFDAALQRQRDWLALTNVVAGAGLLALVVGASGFMARSDLPTLRTQVAAGDMQLKTSRDQLAALGQRAAAKPDARLEQEVSASRQLLALRGEVLQFLRQGIGPGAVSYAEQLRAFARQSVAGLWLTRFDFNANPASMEIHGRTTDPALLPEYLRRLNREPAFQGRAFAALKLTEGKPDPLAAAPTQPRGAGMPMAPVAQKAPYHDFMLIPQKAPASGDAGKPAVLTQSRTAGGAG
jgi:hypothetical protein